MRLETGPIVLDAEGVQRALSGIDVRAELAGMFAALATRNAVQPPQTLSLFPAGRGDVITYLGVLAGRDVFGAKLSPYLPGRGGAVVTAWTLLLSMKTGQPLLLCDSKQLTTEWTAGTTALAVDLLARSDARTLAIVGTGPIGLAHLRHVSGLRGWTDVRLCSPRAPDRADLPRILEDGCPVTITADTAEAVAAADVVLLCTSSGTPVIDVGAVKRSALVTSISTNVADAHEIDPAALPGLQVYCDEASTTPQVAGEMRRAVASGAWSADDVRGDLAGLVAGTAPRPHRDAPVFFRSVGLGLEDIALASAVHRAVTQESRP